MNIYIKQLSSLEKVFEQNPNNATELNKSTALCGERFSYQLEISAENSEIASFEIKSELSEYIQLYVEKNAICDMPTYKSRDKKEVDGDYLAYSPCCIPDILVPIEQQNNRIRLSQNKYLIWVRVDIPKDLKAKDYKIVSVIRTNNKKIVEKTFTLTILPLVLPKNELIYTQWIYNDCIASIHNVDIYSEKHWEYIEKYIETASDLGINMILTPTHTPPLDTKVGSTRPNVQLMKVEKVGSNFYFDFSLLHRWLGICKKYNINYIEIPHFFTQWGAYAAPNIYIIENGTQIHMFGWHTKCDSKDYIDFLRQYIIALKSELEKTGFLKNTFFHISDEPENKNLKQYKKCSKIISEIDKDLNIIDALSDINIYKSGCIKTPIPATNAIEPFLKEHISKRFIYYCCGQGRGVSNRFIAMSSARNRIIGFQMYKFGICGFLHWGFNYYYSENSEYVVNPYVSTSSDYAFPSGDAFSVYPGQDKPYSSIRAQVFYEALQDISLCKLLERFKSKEYIVKLIDKIANTDLRFDTNPQNDNFVFELRKLIINKLKECNKH